MSANKYVIRVATVVVCVAVAIIAVWMTQATSAQIVMASDGGGNGSGDGGNSLVAKGVISSMPSGSLFGSWVISGNTYSAITGTTTFRQEDGSLKINGCAEVRYTLQGNDRIAVRISSTDSCGSGDGHGGKNDTESTGVVASRPASPTLFGEWNIGGSTYQAISGTTVFREERGLLATGACAQVDWFNQAGQRVASQIASVSLHECSPENEDNAATGAIQTLPVSGTLGVWQIGGLSYTVVPTTVLKNGPFVVGALVEVHFNRLSDGTLLATTIERKGKSEGDENKAKLFGRIQTRPVSPTVQGTWVVASTTLSVITTTRLIGALNVGDCAEVHYHVDTAGANIADKIKSEGETDCNGPTQGEISRAFGSVESLPMGGFTGDWKIGGNAYQAISATVFNEQNGALIVGAFVKVAYRVQSGVRVAVEIETEVAPPDGGDTDLLGTLTVNGNTWSVDGKEFSVDASTLFDDHAVIVQNGTLVRVNVHRSAKSTSAASASIGQATKVVGLTSLTRIYLPLARR